ncbi:MAG: hypothetical protein HY791_24915 [Deltaproteobacteria bacterium]|nr:hypothetical protein [Deltaproteobacteria bacterium]
MVSAIRPGAPSAQPLVDSTPSSSGPPQAASPDGFTRIATNDAGKRLKAFTEGSGRVDASATSDKPSKWWPAPDREMDVDIDGYDFDFNPENHKNGGEVDGPLSHDGRFSILENSGDKFRMKVNVGSDDAQKGDLNVDIKVVDGQATITGSVKGQSLPDGGVSSAVAGSGTKKDPFRLEFHDQSGKSHSITWRPE